MVETPLPLGYLVELIKTSRVCFLLLVKLSHDDTVHSLWPRNHSRLEKMVQPKLGLKERKEKRKEIVGEDMGWRNNNRLVQAFLYNQLQFKSPTLYMVQLAQSGV